MGNSRELHCSQSGREVAGGQVERLVQGGEMESSRALHCSQSGREEAGG